MGYRSEVRALIYGDPAKIDALCMKWRHTETLDLWHTDAFGASLTEWTVPGEKEADTRFIELHGNNWKWYEGYADVDAWGRFMEMAEELGLNTEFVRIGEEPNDIETNYCGDDCQYLLGVHRNTYSDAPGQPEEDAEPASVQEAVS